MITRDTKASIKMRNRDDEDIKKILRLRNIKPLSRSFNSLKKQFDEVSAQFWKSIEASNKGVLCGHENFDQSDLKFSEDMLKRFKSKMSS